MMKISTEILDLEGVPSLLLYEEKAIQRPLVFVFHGFMNDKYEGIGIAMKLCQNGYSVLCMDIDRHGDRYDGFMDEIESGAHFGMELFKVVENTYEDFRKVLLDIEDHIAVDINKVGLIGISHGANICNYIVSVNPGIASCVSLLGTPKFTDQLVYSMEKETIQDFESDEEKELIDYVMNLDPYESLKTTMTSILMINASKDDDVPFRFSQSFCDEIQYKENTCIEFVLEDEFHYVSGAMENKAIAWTEKYLR